MADRPGGGGMKIPMLANPTGRSTVEWIGRTNDAMPPKSVCLRILARQGGKCALTRVVIRDGDETTPDHIKELILGGENRESNIQIILRSAHPAKTNAAMKIKRKADKQKAKGLMKPAPKAEIKSPPFAPPPAKDRERPEKTKIGDGSGRWIFGQWVKY